MLKHNLDFILEVSYLRLALSQRKSVSINKRKESPSVHLDLVCSCTMPPVILSKQAVYVKFVCNQPDIVVNFQVQASQHR